MSWGRGLLTCSKGARLPCRPGLTRAMVQEGRLAVQHISELGLPLAGALLLTQHQPED